jgi:NTE family protein
MKRALVLGGGGIVGVAWETAILAGLMAGGVDVRDADLIVGTSAGSVVGSQIARGRDPREMMREGRERPAPPAGDKPDVSAIAAVFGLWGSVDEMTPEDCARIGRLAIEAKTMSEEDMLARFESNGADWPAPPLLVTAVDCGSGELRVFDAASGVPVQRAVSASCSVPGMFPPVTIEGRRFMDGGVRSGTSADLARRIMPDVVLVVAPMGSSTTNGFGKLMAKAIAREKEALEAAGAKVAVVQFDDAAKQAGAGNLMDPAAAAPAAVAGEAHGRRIAEEIGALWSGATVGRP